MKYYGLLLAIGCGITTGVTVAVLDTDLTPEEDDCFDWFHSFPAQCGAAFNRMSERNQLLLQRSANLDAITEYVDNIFAIFDKEIRFIPYDKTLIIQSMFKVKRLINQSYIPFPIGPTTARLWVFNKLLTEQEKAALQKDNYLKDPDRARQVCRHYAEMVVGLIEDIDKYFASTKHKYFYYDEKIRENKIEKIAHQKSASIQQLYCEK